jgi:hypothetical protein
MRKGNVVAIPAATFFFLRVGCFGLRLRRLRQQRAPGNLLTGFGFYKPYWLVDFANTCIILHILGGYQVCHRSILNWRSDFLSAASPISFLSPPHIRW